MKPETPAKWVTPVVVLTILGFAVAKRNGLPRPPKGGLSPPSVRPGSSPQGTVYATLEAARAGDTRAYLDLYGGSMRASLDQTVAEKGDASFRAYLRSASGELKRLAVFGPKPMSDTQVQVRVEYVYQDRNEMQSLTLEKSRAGWKIVQSENAERVKTLVPYGTPVQSFEGFCCCDRLPPFRRSACSEPFALWHALLASRSRKPLRSRAV